MVLPLLKLVDVRHLRIQFVDEELFVLQMLSLVSHQVHLLDPHAPVRVLHVLHSLLVESRLAVGQIGAAVFDLHPALLK